MPPNNNDLNQPPSPNGLPNDQSVAPPAEIISPTPPASGGTDPGLTSPPTVSAPPDPQPPLPSQPFVSPDVPAQPAITQPASPNQPFVPPSFPAGPSATQPPTPTVKKKKTKLIIAIVVLIVLLLVCGYVFAFYIPNKPQNVYNTGLNRSGQAISKIVDQATEQKSLENIKRSNITGTIDAKTTDTTYSGSLDVKFDPSKSNGSLSVTVKQKDQPDQKLSANFLSDLPAGTEYPNIYFQIIGIKSFGLADLVPGLSDYDSKWISIDAAYLKSFGYTASTEKDNEKKQIGAADVSELAKAATAATTDYIFTSDPQKAVFVQKKFVGKETVDGLKTYHYQVGINKDHAKAYCSELVTKVYDTNAYKKLPWVDASKVDEDKANTIKDCQSSIDSDYKESETMDMWIDAKYKLIHKIREYDSTLKDTYSDIGQTYTGGDNISFFVANHSGEDKSDSKFTLDLNLKTYDTKGTFTIASTDKDNPYDAKVVLEAKPYSQDIKADKPAGAIPIKDVLGQLGVDPAMLGLDGSGGDISSSSSASAANTERETDIKALHGQIEAYYAQYGRYPTLANVNDVAWRSTNMKGLDKEALKDPSGSSYTLSATPGAKVYSYEVFAADGTTVCNNTTADCAVYTLTTTLDGGGTFTKSNLN